MCIRDSFTAYLIAKGIEYSNKDKNINIKYLICGGGRKNNFLINCIKDYLAYLPNLSLDKIDNYKYNGDYIESQGMALLSIRFLNKKKSTFTSTTGIKREVYLGESC